MVLKYIFVAYYSNQAFEKHQQKFDEHETNQDTSDGIRGQGTRAGLENQTESAL
jgi:hypothetical protein